MGKVFNLIVCLPLALLFLLGCAEDGRLEAEPKPTPKVSPEPPSPALEICTGEGEYLSSRDHCCDGLIPTAADSKVSVGGNCFDTKPMQTISRICIKCGDNICGTHENVCNCRIDCLAAKKSEYATIKEYCEKAWNEEFSQFCLDKIISRYPPCGLCEYYFDKTESEKNCDLRQAPCKAIISNGPSHQKLDVVFVPINYVNYKKFYEDVNKALFLNDVSNPRNRGLFAIEPLKSHQKKFNIHVLETRCIEPDPSGIATDIIEKVLDSSCSQVVDEVIAIVDDPKGIQTILETRSGSTLAGKSFMNYFLKKPETIGVAFVGRYDIVSGLPITISHEFGHSFGLLCDEYAPSGINYPGDPTKEHVCPNCAIISSGNPQTPCPKWKDVPNNGCYKVCDWLDTYRPAELSILAHGTRDEPEAFEFNEVSKRAIEKRLQRFS